MPRDTTQPVPDFDVLITAEEAWPAFERAVLAAREEIVAGFRIFDLSTRLRSVEGLAVGEDWFDLLADALRRGVKVTLVVSDFDPVIATPLHEMSWRTVRQGAALAEVTGAGPEQLQVRATLHPAQPGTLPYLAFLPAMIHKKLRRMKEVRGIRRRRQAVGLDEASVPEIHTVTHHQKLAVIDGEVLYVGGLDLNERRYDTRRHELPAEQSWSDVQVILRGPEAKDARAHLLCFENLCGGNAVPGALPGIRRTLSCPRRFQMPFLSPRTLLHEIEEAHLNAFRSARHLIYAETQFLRSGVIADTLAEAGVKNQNLTAFFVLPALPEDVAFEDNDGLDAGYGLALQREAVDTLTEAFGDRVSFSAPVRPVLAARDTTAVLAGSPIVYVHNKVLVKDDDFGLVGSANLNGRSLRWDTEVAVELKTRDRVARLREKLFAHWWFDPLPEEARAPQTLQGWWDAEIRRNGVRLPENRSGFLVPYDSEMATGFEQPLPGVTEDVV
ncbi:phospholipase D family protein [Sagittula salina]|uniref:Phospholipase D n=1 Tax=Sagittula salina TaxID=2820268 RepID=A0A940S1J5_9RHOB|nr:phospholipase D family protein [Sagittula salina]MBP0483186.1 phosphatidylserine synthase [Sagittula salina]